MSAPTDPVAADFSTCRVWTFEKIVGEREVITGVICRLSMHETPLLEATAELPPPDPEAFADYWRDADHPLWNEMQDPSGFERPEYVQRDKLAPWAWSVLDKAALEAEGLAKWREILAARHATPAPTLAERLAALEARQEPVPDLQSELDGLAAKTRS